MKNLKTLDHLRDVENEVRLYGAIGRATEGLFWVDGLAVLASVGGGWDHVSVSHGSRTPTWEEMEKVKRMFFEDHQTAMQLHVPVAEHISGRSSGRAQFCLHLWRPTNVPIPTPPSWMVDNRAGVKDDDQERVD